MGQMKKETLHHEYGSSMGMMHGLDLPTDESERRISVLGLTFHCDDNPFTIGVLISPQGEPRRL
jgi:hypothetical protein